MRIEYTGLSEIKGSLIALEGVQGATYDELAEILLPDGSRRVNSICEVCGMQGNVPTVGSIMKFQKTGVDSSGRIKGEFRPTGSRIVSEDHKERFYSNGVEIKSSWFDNGGLW